MKRLTDIDLNTPTYYDVLYKSKHDKRHFFMDRARWKAMREKIVPGVKRVIEVGSGISWFLATLRGSFEVHALDYSPYAMGYVDGKWPWIKTRIGSCLSTGYPEGFFDVVVAGELVEHMEDPSALVRELFRITKPKGWTTITTVDTNSPGAIAHGPYPEHLWEFSSKDLISLFRCAGYPTIEYLTVGNYHLVHAFKDSQS